MDRTNIGRLQRLDTWHNHDLTDYQAVGFRIPVLENTVTQVAPGTSLSGATIVSNREVTLLYSFITFRSIGFVLAKPGYTGFYIPLRWSGDLRVNGTIASPHAIHMPVEDVTMHIRGGHREQLGCFLPRKHFFETIAALYGVEPDKIVLRDSMLDLSSKVSNYLRTRLASLMSKGMNAENAVSTDFVQCDFSNLVFELMLDTYLHARPETLSKSGRARNPALIVRKAEEYFMQAGSNPISLADLCAATMVSKSTLYAAFQSFCGEPPILYFYKRRLTKARSLLFASKPQRGAVKHVAYSIGLTELGRFSRDYRQLFGESPSVTLSKSI